MSINKVFRGVCAAGGVLLLAGAVAPGATAVVSMQDSGDVQATVRKTVRQTANAAGEVDSSRMYMQVSAVGTGTKTVKVPVGVTSNRNLNAFGPFPMEGESVVFDLDVDGSMEERTLTEAPFEALKVSVRVLLDGQEIEPADLVGADGVVDVEYTVRNTTARQQEVIYSDWEGNEQKATIEVADPYAGSLDITLPMGFNEITAPGATVAGNGQNETNLGYTFVLFPPLGNPEAKVSYQARVTNGQMPAAVFSFLPIVPFDNSTIAGTLEAYKGGIQTGATIAGAGQEIGDNLLKLQAGAGQLVAGLGQLRAGAAQLSDGLVNTAAPGSAALADGANQLADGLQNTAVPGSAALADGANQVSDGLNQLNSNVPALESGVSQLNDGAQQLDAGAEQLSDGLNELNKNVPALQSGVSDLNTGAQKLSAGMAQLEAGIDTLSKGVAVLPTTIKDNPGYKQLQGALAEIQSQIGQPTDSGTGTALGALNTIAALSGGADVNATTAATAFATIGGILDCTNAPATPGCAEVSAGASALTKQDPNPAAAGVIQQVKTIAAIAEGLKLKLFDTSGGPTGCLASPPTGCGAAQALGIVSAGIDQLVKGISDELLKGIGTTPVNPATCSPTTLTCASAQLAAGASQLAAGTAQLNSQVPTLAAGVSQLAAGGAQLAGGTEQLADGTAQLDAQVPTLANGVQQLDDGAAQVADGADQLAAGLVPAADGAAQVADGADQLAAGLGAAADGSGQLADGLTQAEPGAGQIEDGAGQLKEQGADELVKSGAQAQLGFAADVASLQAQQLLGEQGAGIPFGPAEGTDTITTGAIQLQLAGIAADTENNAVKYGLGAALIAGAAGAAYAARRKVVG